MTEHNGLHKMDLRHPADHKPSSPYREVWCACGEKVAPPTLSAQDRRIEFRRHVQRQEPAGDRSQP